MLANVVVWVFLAVVWGSTWLVIKIGLNDLPPFTFAGLRFTLAAAVLLGVLVARGILLPRNRQEWTLLAGTAFFVISFQYGLQFWAQQYVASGLASVLTAMIPVFTLVIAHWTLPDEPMTGRKVAGVLLGLAGVAIIFSDQLQSEGILALWGSVALIVGGFGSAWAQVVVKKSAGRIDPMVIAGWQMAIGTIPLLLVGVWVEGNPLAIVWTPSAVLALLYLALVGSALALFAMYWLFRRMEVTKVLAVVFVNPLVAVVLGWMVLGEALSWRAFAGGAGILTGLGLVLARGSEARRGAPVPVRAVAREEW